MFVKAAARRLHRFTPGELTYTPGSLMVNSLLVGFGVRKEVIIRSKNARWILSVGVKNKNISLEDVFLQNESSWFDVTA